MEGGAVTNREFFIACWEQEHSTFVKVLKAVPGDKLDYRPHPRSRSAAELMWLQVLEKRCWFELLETGDINWKVPPATMSLDEMVAAYEIAHRELVPRLKQLDDKTWDERRTRFLIRRPCVL